MSELTFKNEYFSIEDTLTCGQVFRYKKISETQYEVYSLDKRCVVKTQDGIAVFTTDAPEYFEKYFDLERSYEQIATRLSCYPELEKAVKACKGIRILRQNLTETIFSFIISANNNIKRIQGIIERLCEKYGKKMDGYYAFPTIEELRQATVAELKALGLGYRAQYIYDTARTVESILPQLEKCTDVDTARKILLTQKGIGPKVADCIILFGLNLTKTYPVDTWIFKANKTETLDTPKKVHDYFIARYGDDAGIAQQYIFHYERNVRNLADIAKL